MKEFYCVCDGLTLKDKVKCVAEEDEEFKAKCDEKFTDCDACMILQDLIEGGLSHEDCEYYKLYEPISEMNIRQHLPKDFPKIICLCGSTRFSDAFKQANLVETLKGNIVLSIGCDTKSDTDLLALGELTEELKASLDELHKRKIDLADEILVLNVDHYIGNSTRSEIEYAIKTGKEIRYLLEDI